MSSWIAFIRGVGGGIRPLPMKDLQRALEDAGLSDVRTYIQSGNVVFRRPRSSRVKLEQLISRCIADRFGFQPTVMVLAARDLAAAASGNPFPEGAAEPRSLHLFFLGEAPPAPDIAALNRLKAASEAFVLRDRVFYLHTPKGFGVSRLAVRVEKLLGVAATARNWRTVTAMLALAQET
jgi:uncharacterized protein (DUF1697 family)